MSYALSCLERFCAIKYGTGNLSIIITYDYSTVSDRVQLSDYIANAYQTLFQLNTASYFYFCLKASKLYILYYIVQCTVYTYIKKQIVPKHHTLK